MTFLKWWNAKKSSTNQFSWCFQFVSCYTFQSIKLISNFSNSLSFLHRTYPVVISLSPSHFVMAFETSSLLHAQQQQKNLSKVCRRRRRFLLNPMSPFNCHCHWHHRKFRNWKTILIKKSFVFIENRVNESKFRKHNFNSPTRRTFLAWLGFATAITPHLLLPFLW
jgi:hypothetical protein